MYRSAVKLRPVEPGDIAYVASRMREADASEVWAAGHYTPGGALAAGVESSGRNCCTVTLDGIPVAILGMSKPSLLSTTGIPWMLGTDDLLRCKRDILTEGRRIVDAMLCECDYLVNAVHVDNTASIRWLKWLGFTFREAAPYGKEKQMFHIFEMRAHDV